jgi:thioredoxin-dependent peroxiredoxin
VQVVGASVDKPATNERFAGKYGLGFPLVSDPDREVTRAFDVGGLAGSAKRSTFLIDADGTVRMVYDKVRAKGHAARVLEDARAIWG